MQSDWHSDRRAGPPSRPADLQEVEGPNPDDNKGAYVNTEGFITVKGTKRMGNEIATVAGEHKRGATTLQVLRALAGWLAGRRVRAAAAHQPGGHALSAPFRL